MKEKRIALLDKKQFQCEQDGVDANRQYNDEGDSEWIGGDFNSHLLHPMLAEKSTCSLTNTEHSHQQHPSHNITSVRCSAPF